VNSLPKTVTRQRHDCDLNPGPSAPESSTLTTRLPSKAAVDILTSVDKGAQPPPQWPGKKGRGYFYQMSSMYTSIAYLIEIRKFC